MKDIINRLRRNSRLPFLKVPLLTLAACVGFLVILNGCSGGDSHDGHDHGEQAAAKKETMWTCSMHPQIKQPKKGKCPLCFMDLVPVEDGSGDDGGPRQLKLSPTAVQLADIQTAPVERKFVAAEIRMVGKIKADETKVKTITAWVPGRLDRLFVDYTGIPVRKGDHLVSIYSPELVTAQQELLQAIKSYKRFRSGKLTVKAAREKLLLWGLSPKQVESIEKRGKTTDRLTIYSPLAGIVLKKHALEGSYVKTGTPIYTIADLSRVWVKLNAYESDLSWIRYGQTVEFQTEAYPGETFNGRISFIDPVLDPRTRTINVRVNVGNKDFKLKPEMFVRAVVKSKLSVSGKVMDPQLAGKWISPMHPEIIKDHPGTCDICGMALVKAESLGFVSVSQEESEAPLVIPATAPLLTGTRAVVYVQVEGKKGVFQGKEITLGPRAGAYYLVKDGLEENQKVVVNGAFKIDSDLQIQAKPSMMSPDGSGGDPHAHHHGTTTSKKTGDTKAHDQKTLDEADFKFITKKDVPEAFKKSVDKTADGYFAIQHALSSDSLEDAKKAGHAFLQSLDKVDMKLLKHKPHMAWMKLHSIFSNAVKKLVDSPDISAARVQLEIITKPMTIAIKTFSPGKTKVYLFHCPMAFDDKGAYWLQNHDSTRNPYFGDEMLICKDSVEEVKVE